ncbi:MAG TPA: 2-dehydropantoate 2-reductase [Prosthecobacter sp.]|nr:2-dehydropantoate 2-reductase [Prosthecobacter sp.]
MAAVEADEPAHSPLGRVAVVGAGAVGCYYGGRLAQHGNDVRFLMRSDLAEVREHGLKILSPLGDLTLAVPAYGSTREMEECDLVLIAMKATSNEFLLELLPPLLHKDTALLTLQNGLGNEEFLAAHFGAKRVLGGLCFVCINRTAPGVVRHIAQGRVSLGEHDRAPGERARRIAEEFRRCGIECVVEPSLAAARWKKLVWNIPFNGLAIAEGGKDTAAILADAALEARVRALMTEIITTARALGHEVPFKLIPDMIERTRTMSRYKPSSLIDFEEGRAVELEAIWGEPVRRARAAGVAMPLVEELHEQLRRRISTMNSAA